MKVINVNVENFEELVLKSEKPVLVTFSATWCAPCKMLSPILDNLASQTDSVSIVKIDVDSNVLLAKEYQVRGVPSLLLFKSGIVVNRTSGVQTIDNLIKFTAG
jgi:thioredoxin 1